MSSILSLNTVKINQQLIKYLLSALMFLFLVFPLHSQFHQYLGDPVITNGVPVGANMSDSAFIAPWNFQRVYLQYTASELGKEPMYINEISFYFSNILNFDRNLIMNFSVLYKFSSENFTFPSNPISSNPVDFINSGIPLCNATGTFPSMYCFNAEWCTQEAGYEVLHDGVFNVPAQSGWFTLPFPSPIYYNGTDDLYLMILCDDGLANSFANISNRPVVATYPVDGVGGSVLLRSQYINENLSIVSVPNKPIIRMFTTSLHPVITLLQPGNDAELSTEFIIGDIINPAHIRYTYAEPKFSVSFANFRPDNEQAPYRIYYEIQGPLPTTNVVYRMHNPYNMSNN